VPTLNEAFDFVRDPQTTPDQLRLACEILGLEQTGDRTALLARLDEYLIAFDADQPIVCLNPATSAYNDRSQ
jgi:hypothetical protein